MQFFSIISASLLAGMALAAPAPAPVVDATIETRSVSEQIGVWQDADFLGLKSTGSAEVGQYKNSQVASPTTSLLARPSLVSDALFRLTRAARVLVSASTLLASKIFLIGLTTSPRAGSALLLKFCAESNENEDQAWDRDIGCIGMFLGLKLDSTLIKGISCLQINVAEAEAWPSPSMTIYLAVYGRTLVRRAPFLTTTSFAL
ncbi:hypothetical protein BDZ45DRAFT_736188 [Acephala macrosclerotiorum]|nr:hypothetical protein BDZ45DRAFT_736188 [Acephala macrosclerotiorum]